MKFKDLILKNFLKHSTSKNNIVQDWSFQDMAIKNIVQDFKEKPTSRNLVVIPTGGGKTLMAIRAINEMIKKNFLTENKRAIWIVHLKSLKVQAEREKDSKKNIEKFNLNQKLSKILEIRMKVETTHILNSQNSKEYKLLIIDEAHHSVANTYQSFFNENIGILGLTATPTRTDEKGLNFDKISYSITFKELMKKGVILLPEFKSIETNISIGATSLKFVGNDTELDKFDIAERNNIIAEEIFKKSKIFKKIIVFVGTNNHVKSLYGALVTKNKFYNNPYKHIGYIYSGDNNEKGVKNEHYLEEHKQYKSSILVNCRLLNEGYNDSNIDTVVMAIPTNSLLYYIQCIGRVVRNPSMETTGKAYVLEIYDNLPNVNYRIDNRWLFAEISDYLEPEIIDEQCLDYNDFKNRIDSIFKIYNIRSRFRKVIPKDSDFNNISMLFFNSVPDMESSSWEPLFITSENKEKYVSLFNEVSHNMDKYYGKNMQYILFEKLQLSRKDFYFSDRKFAIAFVTALERAHDRKKGNEKVDCLKYITFSKKRLNLWSKIVYFIKFSMRYIYKSLLNKN